MRATAMRRCGNRKTVRPATRYATLSQPTPIRAIHGPDGRPSALHGGAAPRTRSGGRPRATPGREDAFAVAPDVGALAGPRRAAGDAQRREQLRRGRRLPDPDPSRVADAIH